MIHRCICSQYSLEAPTTQKRDKDRTEATASPGAHAKKPRPRRGEGGADRPALNGQTAGRGSRADLAIIFRCLQRKFSNICAFTKGGGERNINAGSFVASTPNQSSTATGLSQAGRGCHHSFFFSSMETPPGPRATTRSKPPITDMVWKKSYLRKSCMGL